MTNRESHFDELDLREEPARTGAAAGSLSTTFKCTATDACTSPCATTRYCN